MSEKLVKTLGRQIDALHITVVELKNDVEWLKKIIVAAASLGLIGKLYSLLVK